MAKVCGFFLSLQRTHEARFCQNSISRRTHLKVSCWENDYDRTNRIQRTILVEVTKTLATLIRHLWWNRVREREKRIESDDGSVARTFGKREKKRRGSSLIWSCGFATTTVLWISMWSYKSEYWNGLEIHAYFTLFRRYDKDRDAARSAQVNLTTWDIWTTSSLSSVWFTSINESLDRVAERSWGIWISVVM